MKAALVYTSTTPELIQTVEDEVKRQLGAEVSLLSYQDPAVLSETRDHGSVTASAAARLVTMFMQAVQDGAEAILNICSSVGETADAVQDLARYIGVPIVRIDEEMCRDAVRHGSRIAVLATLPTTLEPTKNTLRRVAREMGREITLVDGLVDAFGADQATFKTLLAEKAKEAAKEADVILLCQGSMAYAEDAVREASGKFTVSSPRYGAAALKKALQEKGVLKC